MSRILAVLLFGVLILAAPLPGISADSSVPPLKTKFSSGTVGGVFYLLGAGISEIVREVYPQIELTVIPGAGVSNQVSVGKGETLIGLGFPPMIKAAVEGREPFDAAHPNLRTIARKVSFTYVHFTVVHDSGITSIDDIREKRRPVRIVTNVKGSSDEWSLRKVLGAYGITYEDITRWGGKISFVSHSTATSLMQDGHADLYVANIAAPASSIQEIGVSRAITFLPLSERVIDQLAKQYALSPDKIPAGTYRGVNVDAPTVAWDTTVIANAGLSEAHAYAITRALSEKLDRVQALHPSAKFFDPKTAWTNTGGQLHLGAEKYYREKGYIR